MCDLSDYIFHVTNLVFSIIHNMNYFPTLLLIAEGNSLDNKTTFSGDIKSSDEKVNLGIKDHFIFGEGRSRNGE